MKKTLVSTACVLGLLMGSLARAKDKGDAPMPASDIQKAVTFYASFDDSLKADVGGGERVPRTRFNHETEPGRFVFEKGFDESIFRVAAEKGVQRGAIEPTDVLPRNGRIFYPAKNNIAFKPGGWSGAASFWLNTDPNKLLKTKFCDPIQITHKGSNNGGIWFDFNDATPRDARMGVFPAVPAGEQPIKEEAPDAPLVWVKGIDFKSGQWHHVVLSWRNFDTGRADAVAELYIDGKRIGGVQDRAIAMDWDLEQTGIYVAVNYLGLLDELALFGRSLNEAEIGELFRQPGLLESLRK